MTSQYYEHLAREDFARARRRAFLQAIADLLTQRPRELVPFEEVRTRLNIRGSTYRGLQQVPLDKIIGSEGRYADFDRRFLPLRTKTQDRWTNIDVAHYTDVPLPPVELYKVGEVYFVKDGNHRVSVARERGQKEIDAYVTEYHVDVPLDERLSVRDLLLKEEYSDFLEWTNLAKLRPQQRIELSALGGYLELIGHINDHRYYLSQQRGREVSLEEAVSDWYDNVYVPLVEVIRRYDILAQFPGRTEADLALWIMNHRRALAQDSGQDPGPELATLDYLRQHGQRSVLDTVGRAAQSLVSSARIALIPPPTAPPLELLDFLEWSKLDQLCPEAQIRLSDNDYGRLRSHILDHRFYLSLDQGRDVPLDEAIVHWCREWYLPVVREIRAQDILRHFPGRTETDLFLWIMDHLHLRKQAHDEMDIPTAAADFTARFGAKDEGGHALERLLGSVLRLLKRKPSP
ncbi:DUF4032 domain-containing protein [Kallotenue papyrolyticum]|uniref:DUF4032 domain-containing protein n=1 Tax=Kallotenue papyrolyticum TaxID=1325125 RepID=UPI000472B809|nr:DUF4032 domain-containing protein [Kallotenue papyrolyticum]